MRGSSSNHIYPHFHTHTFHTNALLNSNLISKKREKSQNFHHENQVKRSKQTNGASLRKIFSDFRLIKIKIGNFISEISEIMDQRDMRLRFYFRNIVDKELIEDVSTTTLSIPDKLLLFFNKGALRMIIPAEHIISIEILRDKEKIVIETDGWATFEERILDGTQTLFKLTDIDPTGGELWREKKIEVWLNEPISNIESKWNKNHRGYIDRGSKFHNTTYNLNLDPCSTLQGILEQWTRVSTIGFQSERLLFQRSQLGKLDKLLDIFSGLLKPDSALTAPMNGMLNIIRTMGSKKIDQEELLEKVKQALFLIPEYLILKSLDTMFKKELDDPGSENPENGYTDTRVNPTNEG
ncbi:hypothetical protein PCANB_002588 [Pneumocystis canis]|nr:hypothetical protein PCK1_002650 [Pneumocystis canis]KAG5438484.1 hypothetical protein PCANB_002588 [Pneumocystis canis]